MLYMFRDCSDNRENCDSKTNDKVRLAMRKEDMDKALLAKLEKHLGKIDAATKEINGQGQCL